MRQVLNNWEDGISIGSRIINNLRHHYNKQLKAKTRNHHARTLQIVCIKYGLSINRNKSKFMLIDRNNKRKE